MRRVTTGIRWTVLIPAKGLPAAKSRLAPASVDADAHARLVAALRADTIAAAQASPDVARVLLVVDSAFDPGATSATELLAIEQIRPGLNAAVSQGAEYAAREWPDDGVAALVGDLPALRPEELSAALTAASAVDRGYVADAAGTGTTLLTAAPGMGLEPQFGTDSAARHAHSSQLLPAGPGLRHDVDTLDDLRSAVEIGVGPATLTATIGLSSAQPSAVYLSGR